MTPRRIEDLAATVSLFSRAAWVYWANARRCIVREQQHWQRSASVIPDPVLRHLALDTHNAKWADIEGAGAFAAFLAPAHRARTVRTLVAFQLAFDYVDNVAEQPALDRYANNRQLHLALRVALDPTAPAQPYYTHSNHRHDNGYLGRLVSATQHTLRALPSHPHVLGHLRRGAQHVSEYQSINHTDAHRVVLADWTTEHTPPAGHLHGWEVYAAAGSSLDILALIAAAANPTLTRSEAAALAHAYSPWVGATHTMLDGLVDHREDRARGQPNPVDSYPDPAALAAGFRCLCGYALERLDTLPKARQHRLLFTGMSCLYLSAEAASAPHARLARQRIIEALDWTAVPALKILAIRRAVRSSSNGARR